MVRRIFGVSLLAVALAGCAATGEEPRTTQPAGTETVALNPASDIGTLFETYDKAQLALSPLSKAYRGIRDADYDEWGDFTDTAAVREEQLLQKTAVTMRANFDPATLSEQEALSYRLFDAKAKRSAMLFPYREYGYVFDQMNGAQSGLPAFLINIHSVANEEQARAYVSRIEGLGPVLDTLTAESRERAANGVMPPDWVYPYVISDIENLLNAGLKNAILVDFAGKAKKLQLGAADEAALISSAQLAWENSAAPAYRRLLAEMKRQQEVAPAEDGIWRFPEGAALSLIHI